jgi:hypothetical protein
MAELKPGDIVDVVWYPDDATCSRLWNGIAIVEFAHGKKSEDKGNLYSVRVVHNGERGAFYEADLRKLGELEGYDGTNGGS